MLIALLIGRCFQDKYKQCHTAMYLLQTDNDYIVG
jgi:hypothetical protein